MVCGGKNIAIKVRKGVVLATGGYAHNKSFRAAFMPQPVPQHSMSHAGNSGDGISIGQRIGARIAPEEHGHSGLWTPVSITVRPDGSKGLFPHLVLDRAKPGLDRRELGGPPLRQRGGFLPRFRGGHVRESQERALDSGLPDLRCALHQEVRAGVGVSWGRAISPGWSAPAIWSAAKRLINWPARFQLMLEHCETRSRVTIGLQKRASIWILAKARQNSTASTATPIINPIRASVGWRPHHSIGLAVWPADIAVSTGLSTDSDARVLAEDGRPIPGLYACGNDMASVMVGSYPGPGTTLGPALVFAYRAAMHARHR